MKIILKRIDIPSSEYDINICSDSPAIIGRGSLLKCSEKSISRHQGILLIKNGALHIKSTHSNPIYVKDDNCIKTLLNGDYQELNDGDQFCLLKDTFCYKIFIPVCEPYNDLSKETSNNNLSKEENENLSLNEESVILKKEISNSNDGTLHPIAGMCILSEENQVSNNDNNKINIKDESIKGTKRSLPDWMKNSSKQDTPLNEKEPIKKKLKPSWNEEESEKENSNNSIELNTSESEPIITSPEQSIISSQNIPVSQTAAENLEEIPASSTYGQSEEDLEQNLNNNSPAKTSPKRDSCPYGIKCYRKNPSHRQELAHPNDSDYKSESEVDDEDNKPECEFGTKCYRKNPIHRKGFKHTCKRQPKRRAKGNARNPDEISEDDYDFDDEFIDDSSDAYSPSGSETESEGIE